MKHLPLKIRENTVYNVGVSSMDALFSIPCRKQLNEDERKKALASLAE